MATLAQDDIVRRRFEVRGIVQGVGFRPFVHRLARKLSLAGWVRNDAAGVTIEVEGDAAGVERLARSLRDEAPPLARVDGIARIDCAPERSGAGFAILDSGGGRAATAIGPDTAICGDCLVRNARPARPALPVRVHQLHELRSALHDHAAPAVRPRIHQHVRLCPVRDLPRGIPLVARSPLPRRAQRVSGLRPEARLPRRARGARCGCRRRRRSDRPPPARRHPRHQGSWADSISPAMRATPRASPACARGRRARKSRSP